MTTTVRDPWADAHAAATEDALEPGVARVRRRIWLRRAAGLAVELAVLVAVLLLLQRLVDPFGDRDELWPAQVWPGAVLLGLGVVCMVVGVVRSIGATPPFVGPDAFLPRTDRSWLRKQVAENRPVPEARKAVVVDVAGLMVVESRSLPSSLGWVLLLAGMVVMSGDRATLASFSIIVAVAVVRVVRATVWSRRARRWLATYA